MRLAHRKLLGVPRWTLNIAWRVIIMLGLTSPSLSQDCRLALVLALDVSSSVDATEYNLQRQGLALSLLDPEVVRLFLSGPPVAVYVFEWASPSIQVPLLPDWKFVESETDLTSVSKMLLDHPRTEAGGIQGATAIGAALIHASSALDAVPECEACKIDVSGDGRNNVGYGPRYVYANYPFEGVTVNALVIENAASGETDLAYWFRSNVLHGRESFWISADGYEDYQRAMKQKLLRELETRKIGGLFLYDQSG